MSVDLMQALMQVASLTYQPSWRRALLPYQPSWMRCLKSVLSRGRHRRLVKTSWEA